MALEAVQAQAGHASIESTRIYLHLADDRLASQYRKAAEVIDAQFIAFFHAGAAHEEGVRQLMDAEEQVAAHPERGEPVVGPLNVLWQRQSHLANVSSVTICGCYGRSMPIQQPHPVMPRLVTWPPEGSVQAGEMSSCPMITSRSAALLCAFTLLAVVRLLPAVSGAFRAPRVPVS